MSNDSTTQSWVDYIDERVGITRDAVGDLLAEVRHRHADDIDHLRREMTELRNSPPLFSAPDKKLSAAMTRVGAELSEIRESVEASRGDIAERVRRADLTVLRRQLCAKLDAVEEANELIVKNMRGLNDMIFNLGNSLERVHALVARLALVVDAESALMPVDRNHLPAEEKKPAAVVLSLQDLRHARSA
jgi:hypothetical protein